MIGPSKTPRIALNGGEATYQEPIGSDGGGNEMFDHGCGHSSHEYDPVLERHVCCGSRNCRCECYCGNCDKILDEFGICSARCWKQVDDREFEE